MPSLVYPNPEVIADRYIRSLNPVLYLPLYRKDGAKFVSDDAGGNLCTVTGALWTPQGRIFDGTDDVIDCGNNNAVAYLPTGMTVDLWFKFTSIAHTGNDIVIGVGNVSTTDNWRLLCNAGDAGRLKFYILHANDSAYIARQISIASAMGEGEFAHIVITWDGGTINSSIKIFKNAVQVDDTNLGAGVFTGITDTDAPLKIGNGDASPLWTPMTLGESRIWNRALSALEIYQIYLATKWRYV